MLTLNILKKPKLKKSNKICWSDIRVGSRLKRKYFKHLSYTKNRKLNNFRWKKLKVLYFLKAKPWSKKWKFITRRRHRWVYISNGDRNRWVLQRWFQRQKKQRNKKALLPLKRQKWWLTLSKSRRRKPKPRVKWYLRDWIDAKKKPKSFSISLNAVPEGFRDGLKGNWKKLHKYKKKLFSRKNGNKYKKLKKIFRRVNIAYYRKYYKFFLFNFKTKKYSFWYYKNIVKYIKKLFLQRKLKTYKNNSVGKKIKYFFLIKDLVKHVNNPNQTRFTFSGERKHLFDTRRKARIKKQNAYRLWNKKIKPGNKKLQGRHDNHTTIFMPHKKKRRQILRRHTHCFIPLQFYKNIGQTDSNFIKNFKRFLYSCISPCDTMLSWEYTNNDFHDVNVLATDTFWKFKKSTRRIHRFSKRKETRKLKRLKPFFRYFGFRHSKNRKEQPMPRTKKFKKFSIFNKVLRLFNHKKVIRENAIYPIQSFRTWLSYYKMRWQATTYFIQNYFFKKYNRKEFAKLAEKSQKKQKNKLITFTSNIEFTLIHLLLRLRFLLTAGMAHQFVKHGHVFINYKKITHPLFVVKPGDTVSIFIDPLTFHRFYDPIFTYRLYQGLYRKNTGRRSPATMEPSSSFIKAGLNNFSKLKRINESRVRNSLRNVVTRSSGKFQLERPRWERVILKPRGPLVRHATLKNSPNYSSWKHGFIFDVINSELFNRPHIDKLNNILI